MLFAAQESATKSKLEDLEREFGEDDVFDTTKADQILNLTSLANKVEEEKGMRKKSSKGFKKALYSFLSSDQEVFDDFDDPDKDPFDTSAFDDITNEAETELAFESLATRTDGAEPVIRVTSIEDDIVDPFNDTAKGSEIFGEASVKATVDQGRTQTLYVWKIFFKRVLVVLFVLGLKTPVPLGLLKVYNTF